MERSNDDVLFHEKICRMLLSVVTWCVAHHCPQDGPTNISPVSHFRSNYLGKLAENLD